MEQIPFQQASASLRVARIEPSVTLAVSTKAKMMQKQGIKVVDLSAGETDFPPPLGAIKAVQAVLNNMKNKHLLARYTPTLGIPELREAIAKQYSKKTKTSSTISQNHIAVSAGAKQALYNSIAVICNPNDEVLIPAPIWITYAEQVKLCDGKSVFCKTEDKSFAVKADLLNDRITSKTKAIILNSPCNPTGAIIPKNELKKIADLALEHKLWLISDEVYEPFVYEGAFSSVASLGQEVIEKSIIISAASKMFSMTGWRLGYAVAPEPLIKAMDALQGHMTSNASSLAQYAVLGALQDPCTKKYVQTMRNEFKKRRDVMIKRLNEMSLSCQKPSGAFFAFADIAGTHLGSVVLCKELLQNAHVACVPGKAFGSDKHIRLSYATSMAEIKKGMDQMEKWLKCGRASQP